MVNLEKKLLSEKIATAVLQMNSEGIEIMDALIIYAEKNNIDIDIVAAAIKSNAVIVSKLQEEAEGLNYLPKQNRLPV